MEYRKMVLNESEKLNSKVRNRNYVEDMSKKLIEYYADKDKKIRINEEYLCRYCNYIHTIRIGGSAITTVICAYCDEHMTFSSTATDILCVSCADKFKLCKRCGQKID